MFLAINDIKNYQSAVITSLESDSSSTNEILKGESFIFNDYTLYFISKTLTRLNEECTAEIDSQINARFAFRNIFLLLYLFVATFNYLMYKKVLMSAKKSLKTNLENSYLVLPLNVMINNSYLINFFRLNKSRAMI